MSLLSSRRLLVSLSAENSYAWSPAPGELRAVARRRNVSVETGRFTMEAGEALLEAGFAEWQAAGRSGRPRLVLNEAGRARAALVQGASGLEPARVFHGDLDKRQAPEAGGALRVTDDAESPLAWLARRRGRNGEALISVEHFEAGERLRRDLERAQALPRVTSRWDGVPGEGRGGLTPGLSLSDMALAARQRVDKAMQAVGPEFSGLLLDVCGFLKGLETIESERQWPRRSARIVLDLALARLARHYGMKREQADASAPLRHWGTQDFRPAIL